MSEIDSLFGALEDTGDVDAGKNRRPLSPGLIT